MAVRSLLDLMRQAVCVGLILGSTCQNYTYAQQTYPLTDGPTDNPAASSVVHSVGHDDGASLSLTDSDLQPSQPIVGEKADFPAFTREMLQVGWRSNDPIDLYVVRPRGVDKPRAIFYLYSYPSETNRFLDNQYCARVTKDGYAAIGFVSALTGQRYHDRPMREWFVSEMPETLTNTVHDVQMILNYLSSRGDFDLTEVGMFGQGSGGTIAILAAAVDRRIHVLDLLDPWGNWPTWLAKSTLVSEEERPSYLKADFLSRLAPLDPVHWLPELKTPAIRLQFVADDPITPLAITDSMATAAPRTADIVRYKDTRELYQATTGGQLFDWIKQQLKSPARTATQRAHDALTVSHKERPDH